VPPSNGLFQGIGDLNKLIVSATFFLDWIALLFVLLLDSEETNDAVSRFNIADLGGNFMI